MVDAGIQSPGIHVLFGLDLQNVGRTLNDLCWLLTTSVRKIGLRDRQTQPATFSLSYTSDSFYSLRIQEWKLQIASSLYVLRMWVEQSYKHVKHELGWSQYQVRSDKAIRWHWQLVCCAYSVL